MSRYDYDEERVVHRREGTTGHEIRISVVPTATGDGFMVRIARRHDRDDHGTSIHLVPDDVRALLDALEEGKLLRKHSAPRPHSVSAR